MMPAQGESCLSPPKCGDDGGSEAPVVSAVKLQLEPAFQPFLNKFLFSMSEEFAACVEGWAGPEVFTRDALEVFIVRSRHLPGEACEACEALETCEHMPALGREALMQMQPDPADRNGVLTKYLMTDPVEGRRILEVLLGYHQFDATGFDPRLKLLADNCPPLERPRKARKKKSSRGTSQTASHKNSVKSGNKGSHMASQSGQGVVGCEADLTLYSEDQTMNLEQTMYQEGQRVGGKRRRQEEMREGQAQLFAAPASADDDAPSGAQGTDAAAATAAAEVAEADEVPEAATAAAAPSPAAPSPAAPFLAAPSRTANRPAPRLQSPAAVAAAAAALASHQAVAAAAASIALFDQFVRGDSISGSAWHPPTGGGDLGESVLGFGARTNDEHSDSDSVCYGGGGDDGGSGSGEEATLVD